MNIAGDKMFAYLDRIVGEHKPITADVFLTNFCNNACPYCTYKRWSLDGGARAMSFDEFVRYANRLTELGVQGIILTGGGEPTIAPDFMKITGWMESKGISYGINTNFNNLVYIKPNYLKVSLDGYDEDSYERCRGVRKYEQVKSNIRAYAAWKKKNSPHTSLGIQYLAQSPEEVQKFYDANKELDVDYMSFRPYESTGGSHYATAESMCEAAKIHDAIRELQEIDKRVVANFKWNLLKRREADCTAQWAQIAVNERGEVMYCCHKPYQVVGHILDADIMDKKAKAGTDMSMCDVPCRMTAPNMFVSDSMKPRKDVCFI